MAIYHLRAKYVKRSEGRSSVAAAAYRSGTKLHDEREGKTHDYTRKRDVEYSAVMLPEHMPVALQERGALWNAIETGIKRKDGQPAFEVEVALPRELDKSQCVQLVREFAQDMFVARGVPVDINIHRPKASDGGEHPHAHILISTRLFKEDGTLDKAATDMQDNPALLRKIYALEQEGRLDEAIMIGKDTNLGQWRKSWEDYSNRFLDDSGSESRIDHRTLEAQSIDREATPNIGFAFYDRVKEFGGHIAERLEQFRAIEFRNAMREQMDRIRQKAPDRTAEFIAHARAYAPKLFPELQQDDKLDRGRDFER